MVGWHSCLMLIPQNLCVVETEKPRAIEYKECPDYVVRPCVYMYELLNNLSLLHVAKASTIVVIAKTV